MGRSRSAPARRIGANAVVIHDVAPGTTVVGVPAEVARAVHTDTPDDEAVAEHLVMQGQFREAITTLTAGNRRNPSIPVEPRRAHLRHEAFFAVPHDALGDPWPPPFEKDVFSGIDGIPEISASDLSVDTLRAGIFGHGALIVRGLLDPDRCTRLRGSIPLAFAAFDSFESGAADAEASPWYWPMQTTGIVERSWVRGGGGVLAADSPRMLFDLLETLESTAVPEVLTMHFGERPAISVKKTTLRWRFRQIRTRDGIRTAHSWAKGTDRQRLGCVVTMRGRRSIARRGPKSRLDHIVPTGIDGAAFDWSVSDGLAEMAADGCDIVRPIFEPGDAILFDEMNLHRTGAGPDSPSLATPWRCGSSPHPPTPWRRFLCSSEIEGDTTCTSARSTT